MQPDLDIRDPQADESDRLAQLWYDGWRDAHEAILPAELARHRTLESFRDRMRAALATVRVAGPRGAPLGFHMLKGSELYQLYVAREARGTGLAAALIHDAEARLAAQGFDTGWLACAIGNDRAARFYTKAGWRLIGPMTSRLETPEGVVSLEVWRFEKRLTGALGGG